MHAHMAEMEDALADVMTRLGTHVGEQPSGMSH
jgi:hypothetical protein